MAAGDRDNFSGDLVDAAPTGGTTKGLMYNIQDSYFVARETKSATVDCVFAAQGAVRVTKVVATGDTFAIGDKVYFDGTDRVQPNSTGGTLVGIALEDAAQADTDVLIWLQPLPVTAT